MTSKLQEKQFTTAFGQGFISDKDSGNLKEGEWQELRNLLFRNGEFVVRNDLTDVFGLPEPGTTYKIFAYTTDRDENGNFNTTRWIVINTSDGKVRKRKIGGGSWTEIKIHDTTSFNIVVKEFTVINQDLVFHTGHSGYLGHNTFVYGYRTIPRVGIFEPLGGWYCDYYTTEITPGVNKFFDPTQFKSAYVDTEGSTNYIYFFQDQLLYKAEFNVANHGIGSILWRANIYSPTNRFKIVGVNNTDDEVYIFWDTLDVGDLAGQNHVVLAYNTNTGEFKKPIYFATSVHDVVFREREYDSTKYFFGVKRTTNTVYCFNKTGSTVWSKAVTLFGSDEAVQIEVGYHGDQNKQIYFITGFNDAGNDGEIYVFGDQNTPSWVLVDTTLVSATFGSETGQPLMKGSATTTYDYDLYFLSCFERSGNVLVQRFCSLTHPSGWSFSITKTDTNGNVNEMVSPGYWVNGSKFLTPYDSLPTATLEWFNTSGTSVHSYPMDIIINAIGSGTGTISGDFRYRYVLIFDNTQYSPLSGYMKEVTVSLKSSVDVKLYVRADADLRRITHIQIYRSRKDSTGNQWGEYYLLSEVDLRESIKNVTSDGSDWKTSDSGVTYYATFSDTDEVLTDTYFMLSDLPEKDTNFNVQFTTAFYSNGRLFFGNLRDDEDYHNDRVGYSPLDAPSVNPSTNYITLSKGDPDQITAIGYYDDTLIIGKKNSFYAYDISSYIPQEWYEIMVRDNVGIYTNDHLAITPYGAVFMDEHSAYLYTKQNGVQDIAFGKVRNELRGMASSLKMCYIPQEKVVWFYDGSGLLLVYDIINNGWFKEEYVDVSNSLYVCDVAVNKENATAYVHIIGVPSGYKIMTAYTKTASTAKVNIYIKSGRLGLGGTLMRVREAWIDHNLSNASFVLETDVGSATSTTEYVSVPGSNNQLTERLNWILYSTNSNPGEVIRDLIIRFIPSRLRKR